jgi:hypothetical protein
MTVQRLAPVRRYAPSISPLSRLPIRAAVSDSGHLAGAQDRVCSPRGRLVRRILAEVCRAVVWASIWAKCSFAGWTSVRPAQDNRLRRERVGKRRLDLRVVSSHVILPDSSAWTGTCVILNRITADRHLQR